MKKKALIILLSFVLLSVGMYLLTKYGFETLLSDGATRLAYQIRDEAAALQRSGEALRTFEHHPRARPDGVEGDYRIEIVADRTAEHPEYRPIGVARSLTGPVSWTTTYHLNFVEVPHDLVVSHRKGEPTTVTLERKDGKVLLIGLK